MKKVLQEVFVYSFALYVTSLLLSGLKISEGLQSIVIAGILLTIGFTIARPIVSIITLPFQFISSGLFSYLSLALVLYIITLIYPKVQVREFTFQGLSIFGIHVSSFHFSGVLSYFIISATIYIIAKLIDWLFE